MIDAVVALLLSLLSSLSSPVDGARPKPPDGTKRWNVLMIALDDLNDWTSYLRGHPNASTPYLDQFARTGAAFMNAYAPSSQCLPSRIACLYGLRPTTSGIYNNGVDWLPVVDALGATSIPQHFKNNGYDSIGTGKLFHGIGSGNPGYTPDIWTNYYDPVDDKPETITALGDCNFCEQFGPGTDDNIINDRLRASWIEDRLLKDNRDDEKPFFMAVGFKKPHKPWVAPNKYFKPLEPVDSVVQPATVPNDLEDVPELGRQLAANENQDIHGEMQRRGLWNAAVQAQLATISFADEMVGRVISALDRSKYSENTIVVLWSDHGYHLGEKEHWKKGTLWEDSTHVPCIMRIPGLTDQRGYPNFVSHPVDLMSIYPTLIKMARLPDPSRGKVDGADLWKLLRNPKRNNWKFPAIMSYDEHNAVRKDGYRLIQYHTPTSSSSSPPQLELYRHNTDIHEWTNLANRPNQRARVAKYRSMIPKNQADKIPETVQDTSTDV